MKEVNVVGAVIVNEEKEILCALRSEEMTLPLFWEFPGGKIEKNERAEDALVREIKEELDCTIEVLKKVTTTTHAYENVIVHLTTYISKIISGIPVAKEHKSLQWVPQKQLPTLNWAPADIPAVNLLTNEIKI
ncbi:MAG TPA: (deoxy)nucleoside triphosphate pyrophosphohydrolase [Massilibacterium sp.]|nr:(deoxy)nucleoside triphosphate pyrophosphohydrolase [Massilibacterium sp.]